MLIELEMGPVSHFSDQRRPIEEIPSIDHPDLINRKTFGFHGRVRFLPGYYMDQTQESVKTPSLKEQQEAVLSQFPHMRKYLELPEGDPQREMAIEIARGMITDLISDNLKTKVGMIKNTKQAGDLATDPQRKQQYYDQLDSAIQDAVDYIDPINRLLGLPSGTLLERQADKQKYAHLDNSPLKKAS